MSWSAAGGPTAHAFDSACCYVSDGSIVGDYSERIVMLDIHTCVTRVRHSMMPSLELELAEESCRMNHDVQKRDGWTTPPDGLGRWLPESILGPNKRPEGLRARRMHLTSCNGKAVHLSLIDPPRSDRQRDEPSAGVQSLLCCATHRQIKSKHARI